jgi:beta-N-acetylhexosaminidase
MRNYGVLFVLLISLSLTAQRPSKNAATIWADSVFKTLTDTQKLAQLMIVRLSSIDASTRKITFYDQQVENYIRRYNVGGICLFQGGPQTQAAWLNYFQGIAQTPILVCIDAENGLGMRMDSVEGLPRQMMLGAVQDSSLIYEYGQAVGQQCVRMGIQVNFAPVVDVNNNPDNPVINDRSFGENQYRVASYGIEYMKGMQETGVIACAKHFPGHGDVSVDSHYDLPVINKSRTALDTLELYPFKKLFNAGVGSVMIAHLYIPAIDKRPNRASSLSAAAVSNLLRKQLKYKGISFTDALEMKGVTKYFPDGEASVQSLIAGNDMLCLPEDVSQSIEKIFEAIGQKKIKWSSIDERLKKILAAKYNAGLAHLKPIDTTNLIADLNEAIPDLCRKVAENALTLLRASDIQGPPLKTSPARKVAYIGFGLTGDNEFSKRVREDYNAQVYYFDYSLDSSKAAAAAELLKNRYDVLIVGVHNFNRYPANDFGISAPSLQLLRLLAQQKNTISLVFGNPYALKYICNARNLIACYDDQPATQAVAADWLNGKFTARGKLPVTVCPEFKFDDGIVPLRRPLPLAPASTFSRRPKASIDSICRHAIAREAMPGCEVVVVRGGRLVYEKSFGYLTYDRKEPVYPETLYDLASLTKICATTLSVMKLYEEGKLDLQQTLGHYLVWLRGSNKDSLKVWDLLLHQAGLPADIAFFEGTVTRNSAAIPLPAFYESYPDSSHRIRVAEKLYLRNDWEDSMYRKIVNSPLLPYGHYVYSDIDFILLGLIVESISGKSLDSYAAENFYVPLGMATTGFRPRERFSLNRIAPTESETSFRRQLLHGDVHDPSAALFGGVAGHAGLFSDAYDLAVLGQMLLNGGTLNGTRYLKKETIDYFTAYQSPFSRRGLGFDKPEKDNATRREKEAYPCKSASSSTFGHTGFTGTCLWVDPAAGIVFVFLSNRVYPMESNKLSALNVRGNLMEALYRPGKAN